MRIYIITFFCLLGFLDKVFAGNPDSLRLAYKQNLKNDTTKVNLALELSRTFHDELTDSSLWYANEALCLSEKLNFKTGNALALYEKSLLYKNLGQLDSAISTFGEALFLFTSIGKQENNIGRLYNSLGLTWDEKGDEAKAMECYKKAFDIYTTNHDSLKIAFTYTNMGQSSRLHGRYLQALDYYLKAVPIYESKGEISDLGSPYNNIGIVYKSMEKYDDAIRYYNKSLEIKQKTGEMYGAAITKTNLGVLYQLTGDFVKSEKYTREALQYFKFRNFVKGIAATLDNLASIKLDKNELDSAFVYFSQANDLAVAMGNKEGVAITLNGKAKVYLEKNVCDKAIENALEARNISIEDHITEQEQEADRILSEAYIKMKDYKNGYSYYVQYSALKDSTFNRVKLQRLFSIEKEYEVNRKQTEVDLLERQNQIKELSLSKERVIRYFLIGGLLLIVLFSGILYNAFRTKAELNKELEKQNEEIKTQNDFIESINKDLHAKALRAQINPHFLFNAINSIQQLVLSGNAQMAYDYFARFSKLMRKVLDHSDRLQVSIEDEIETLKLYIDIEALRFDQKFSYQIKTTPTLLDNGYKIPPMLIQPFIENAIWHGLLHKEGNRELVISIDMKNEEQALCTVQDNGVGRQRSMEINEKEAFRHESKGMEVTKERLRLLNTLHNHVTDFKVTDLTDHNGKPSGTKVEFLVTLT